MSVKKNTHWITDLFELAILVLLAGNCFGAVNGGRWGWAAVDALVFLGLVVLQATTRIVKAIEAGQRQAPAVTQRRKVAR